MISTILDSDDATRNYGTLPMAVVIVRTTRSREQEDEVFGNKDHDQNKKVREQLEHGGG